MTLEIRTAEELMDPALEERWTARREKRQADVLQRILREFVERGGPVVVNAITAAFPDRPDRVVRENLGALDEDDLIQVTGDHVVVAYPFSTARTPFVVRLANGAERYACCAIDALGIAPMLGQPVHVRSECHHCRMPREFSTSPHGPGTDAEGVMVWIENRAEGQRRISTSL